MFTTIIFRQNNNFLRVQVQGGVICQVANLHCVYDLVTQLGKADCHSQLWSSFPSSN